MATSTAWAATAKYGYDARGRLISVTELDGTTIAYTYDKAGNRSQIDLVAKTHSPITVPHALTTGVNTAVSINPITDGDHDPDGGTLSVISDTDGAHGTVARAGNTLTYTPNNNFSGTDSFSYTIKDPDNNQATGSVSVTITNSAPVAHDYSISTPKNVDVDTDPTTHATDPDGDTITTVNKTNGSNGTVTRSGNVLTYHPGAGFTGTDTFTYTVADPYGAQDQANVTVTVYGQPVAATDTLSTFKNVPATLDPTGNDTPAGVTVTGRTNGTHGTVTKSGNSLTYTPATGYVGSDSFTYTITDQWSQTATGTVNVTVANRNPTAVNDSLFAINKLVPTSINPLTNDTDPDGDALTVTAVTQPAHGTSSFTGNSVTYTASAGFRTDSFTYTVTDTSGGTAVGTVNATVNRAPVAVDDTLTTVRNQAASLDPTTNDTDADGDTITVVSKTNGSNGTVTKTGNTLTYTPNTGFYGTDTFTYTVNDQYGVGSTGTVTVTVNQNNHAPVAVADSISAYKNTALTFDPRGNDSDPDGDTITIDAKTSPSHGSVAISPTSLTYTPTAGYTGSDSFTYRVADPWGAVSSFVTVSVTVSNRAPVAVNDSISTSKGSAKTFDPRTNDSDPDGDAITIQSKTSPLHGSVAFGSTSLTYTPTAGYTGSDSFTYTITDGTATATATVNATVTNTPPVAVNDSISTSVGAPITFDPRINDTDADGDTLSITAKSTPAHGSVAKTTTSLTYTPTAGYSGTDSFTYTISDGTDTSTATVNATISNGAPTAVDDSINATRGIAKTFDPRTNDTDPDGDTLTITGKTSPSHGTLSFTGTSLTYTPALAFPGGDDTFTYTISDGNGHTATATVTAHVS